jgi:ubiquinone/menaquinone biosynthesis C-methylase UbiE
MAVLAKTYEDFGIHDRWEAAYRGHPALDHFNDLLLDKALRILQPAPGSKFLDAGCGVGDHSFRIRRRGYRVVGVDISNTILQRARQKAAQDPELKVEFQREMLETLSFPDASFDYIHCRGVLMHIPEWERALGELCRVLRPGGGIIIIENNDKSLYSSIARLVHRFGNKFDMEKTESGIELRSVNTADPFLVRTANVAHLHRTLERFGVNPVKTFASEFLDVRKFPAGAMRSLAIQFNRAWLQSGLGYTPSLGVLVTGRKTAAPST